MSKLTKALRETIKKEKISVYRVARAIGVDYSSLYKAFRPEGNLGAKTIDKILDYLGYEVRFIKSKKKGGGSFR